MRFEIQDLRFEIENLKTLLKLNEYLFSNIIIVIILTQRTQSFFLKQFVFLKLTKAFHSTKLSKFFLNMKKVNNQFKLTHFQMKFSFSN